MAGVDEHPDWCALRSMCQARLGGPHRSQVQELPGDLDAATFTWQAGDGIAMQALTWRAGAVNGRLDVPAQVMVGWARELGELAELAVDADRAAREDRAQAAQEAILDGGAPEAPGGHGDPAPTTT